MSETVKIIKSDHLNISQEDFEKFFKALHLLSNQCSSCNSKKGWLIYGATKDTDMMLNYEQIIQKDAGLLGNPVPATEHYSIPHVSISCQFCGYTRLYLKYVIRDWLAQNDSDKETQ